MYTSAHSSVHVNGILSSTFKCNNGLRQGCKVSSLLFNLCRTPKEKWMCWLWTEGYEGSSLLVSRCVHTFPGLTWNVAKYTLKPGRTGGGGTIIVWLEAEQDLQKRASTSFSCLGLRLWTRISYSEGSHACATRHTASPTQCAPRTYCALIAHWFDGWSAYH